MTTSVNQRRGFRREGVRSELRLRFGAVLRDNGVAFRLWAPKLDRVDLKLEQGGKARPMVRKSGGWFELNIPGAGPGTLYNFVLPDGLTIPDPAARFQPDDVHGPSEVIDPLAYEWRDAAWRGRPWEEAVITELHIGTFTEEGTFLAAIERLDTLVDVGITAIELMPVADFPGRWNWGYDGVQLFAPDSSYGRPEDLKALVDAAHARGLMVFLDVVYNHFGPDGNYLPSHAPIFTERHHTPWGAGVNYDAEGSEVVREFIADNALYWIEEFHFDGLRLDAVHTILDDSGKHILGEIAERIDSAAGDREVHLILENDENRASLLKRGADGRPLEYTAQWNDDLHHSLHTAVAGEMQEYYVEYAGNTERLGRSLAEGFSFQGEWTTRNPRPRGQPCGFLPPTAFISFLQNHDQIGNRPFGDRIVSLAAREPLRAAMAIILLSPQIPLLFMGEEWGTARPFSFFSDFGGELAEAIRKGRREEFGQLHDILEKTRKGELPPDPISEATFRASKLDWSEAEQGEHAEWCAFTRRLLQIRHAEIVPRLRGIGGNAGSYEVLGPEAVRVRWKLADASTLILLANLKDKPAELASGIEGRVLSAEGGLDGGRLKPWSAIFSLAGGQRRGD